jgi:hypothetical protein
MATVLCRVQYINDGDPFACVGTSDLEPPTPVQVVVSVYIPVGDQLAQIVRKLRAPHMVCSGFMRWGTRLIHTFSRCVHIH